MRRATLALVIGMLLAACSSPEATRMRAGGAGADVGNRRQVVRMHEGSRPYWGTPRIIHTGGPIDAASQADRLSR